MFSAVTVSDEVSGYFLQDLRFLALIFFTTFTAILTSFSAMFSAVAIIGKLSSEFL